MYGVGIVWGDMMKKRWLAVVIIISFFFGVGGTFAGMQWLLPLWQQSNSEMNTENEEEYVEYSLLPSWEKVFQAYDIIQKTYVQNVDENQLIQGAIQGMVGTLGDPYSVYMDAATAERFNDSLDSSFEGIGAQIGMEEGKIIIIAPIKSSPAEKAGLKPRDQIIKIDDESVEGLDLHQASSKIRGEKGTVVKLEILRSGLSKPMTMEITRDEVPILTVFPELKEVADKKIGYIEVTSFSKDTARDFQVALKDLEKQSIEGLIVDVRGNPGGMLSSVQQILEEIVTGEKPYVQIEERTGKKNVYHSDLEKRKEYPITVLIDEGSASASEILASAVHEIEGYSLIGEKTFGKGTVQQAVPLGDDGSNIKLTMFKWLTPDGNWIHGSGIEPTVEVKQPRVFKVHHLQIEETLEKDMNNESVIIAQEQLQSLGYGPGRTDGYYDDQTEKAVRAFQTIEKLPLTGKIDLETASKMEEAIQKAIQDEKNDLQLQVALKSFLK